DFRLVPGWLRASPGWLRASPGWLRAGPGWLRAGPGWLGAGLGESWRTLAGPGHPRAILPGQLPGLFPIRPRGQPPGHPQGGFSPFSGQPRTDAGPVVLPRPERLPRADGLPLSLAPTAGDFVLATGPGHVGAV